MIALITFCKFEFTPICTSPVLMMLITITPNIDPKIDPRPPDNADPPMTTEAITLNSKPFAVVELPTSDSAVKISAVIAAIIPEEMNIMILTLCTCIPLKRAARGLPPMAYRDLPYTVFREIK